MAVFADGMTRIRQGLQQVVRTAPPLSAGTLDPGRRRRLLQPPSPALAADLGHRGPRAPGWVDDFVSSSPTTRPGVVQRVCPRTPTDCRRGPGGHQYCLQITGNRIQRDPVRRASRLQRRGAGHLRAIQTGRGEGLPRRVLPLPGDEPRRGRCPRPGRRDLLGHFADLDRFCRITRVSSTPRSWRSTVTCSSTWRTWTTSSR